MEEARRISTIYTVDRRLRRSMVGFLWHLFGKLGSGAVQSPRFEQVALLSGSLQTLLRNKFQVMMVNLSNFLT